MKNVPRINRRLCKYASFDETFFFVRSSFRKITTNLLIHFVASIPFPFARGKKHIPYWCLRDQSGLSADWLANVS